jgi:hypothetical protein
MQALPQPRNRRVMTAQVSAQAGPLHGSEPGVIYVALSGGLDCRRHDLRAPLRAEPPSTAAMSALNPNQYLDRLAARL